MARANTKYITDKSLTLQIYRRQTATLHQITAKSSTFYQIRRLLTLPKINKMKYKIQ